MRSPQPSSFLLLVSFFLPLLFLFLLSEPLVEALLLACVSVLVVLEPLVLPFAGEHAGPFQG